MACLWRSREATAPFVLPSYMRHLAQLMRDPTGQCGTLFSHDLPLLLPLPNQPCPIFGQGCQILCLMYISQPALFKDLKKTIGVAKLFIFTTPNWIFFYSLQRYYIVPPSSKISETHSCFWRWESLPKFPKNPFWDFGHLGINQLNMWKSKVHMIHALLNRT